MRKPETESMETKRNCNQCGKTLYGRTDQRFCNDTCRNNFNREKRRQESALEHENVPEIFRIIKRNYEILRLQSTEALADRRIIVPAEKLESLGFNAKFHTSTWHDGRVEWKFCFERGWAMTETDCYITDRPEQAEL